MVHLSGTFVLPKPQPPTRVTQHLAPFVVGPPYRTLLTSLARYYFATPAQLTARHYQPSSLRYVQRLLERLCRNGYAQAKQIPALISRGSGPFVHIIARRGRYYLTQRDLQVPAFSLTERLNSPSHNWPHTLYITDTSVWLDKLAEAFPQIQIEEMTHEMALNSKPLSATLGAFSPDILLRLRLRGQKFARSILIECDKGSLYRERIKSKLAKLASYLSPFRHFFPDEPPPHVWFLTSGGMERVRFLRECAEAILPGSWHPDVAHSFLFTSFKRETTSVQEFGLTRQWFVPFQPQPVALLPHLS